MTMEDISMTFPDRELPVRSDPPLYNPSTFVRLGKNVWYTLESVHRGAAPRQRSIARLEARLERLGETLKDEGYDCRTSHKASWTQEQWMEFLWRVWPTHANEAFSGDNAIGDGDDGTTTILGISAEEQELVDAYQTYWDLCRARDDSRNRDVSSSIDDDLRDRIHLAEQRVDRAVGAFYPRYGDPLQPCQVCRKFALGFKLKRCGRCKLVYYCSTDCQKQDWNRHKQTTPCVVPPPPPTSTNQSQQQQQKYYQQKQKQNRFRSTLIQQRYKLFRRHGKGTVEAMKLAHAEYDNGPRDDDPHNPRMDPGSQVAAMLGL